MPEPSQIDIFSEIKNALDWCGSKQTYYWSKKIAEAKTEEEMNHLLLLPLVAKESGKKEMFIWVDKEK